MVSDLEILHDILTSFQSPIYLKVSGTAIGHSIATNHSFKMGALLDVHTTPCKKLALNFLLQKKLYQWKFTWS
jgi:hypothetical protein